MFALRVDDETSLELIQDEHAAEVFAVVDANRAYLRRWLPWLDQNTAVDHTRAWARANMQQFGARAGFACAIRHAGRVVGVIGLHNLDWVNRKTSIGYWLDESSQGRGLMTRACTALLDHVFRELKLNSSEIACAVG